MTPKNCQSITSRQQGEYVTFYLGDQIFGLPILDIQDVFTPQGLTSVPLAPKEVRGVLNLRGRIVTAIDLVNIIGSPQPDSGEAQKMAFGVDYRGEVYGFLVDRFGEVITIDPELVEANPSNMDQKTDTFSQGVYPMESSLLVLLDIFRVLDSLPESLAA